MTIFAMVTILFFLMDPIGNTAAFHDALRKLSLKRKVYITFREMLIALLLMFLFSLIGERIFSALNVSLIAVKLSIGLILFLSALKILYPDTSHPRRNLPPGEPFIVPLAIPLIANPPLLATIMLFVHLTPDYTVTCSAILIAWLIALLILLSSNLFHKALGENGLRACENLMGMVLVMLAIQRFMDGLRDFVLIYN